MKREITFTFRKSIVPAHSENGNYYFTIFSRVHNNSEYIPDSISFPGESLQFYVARNIEGSWGILGEKSSLPEWVLQNENSYGNAIDESLGMQAITVDIKSH